MKEFKGTWLMIKTGEDYSEPELIEFIENKILHFGVRNESNSGTLTKNETWTENLFNAKIEIVNANQIRFFRKGKLHKVISETESITEDIIYKVEYERIEPTNTNLTEKEIERSEFNGEWNNEKIKFIFNTDLDNPTIQEINKQKKREGRKLILENFRGTFFGAIYNYGNRETLIPIRKISNNQITLYGFPIKPYEIHLIKKNITPKYPL